MSKEKSFWLKFKEKIESIKKNKIKDNIGNTSEVSTNQNSRTKSDCYSKLSVDIIKTAEHLTPEDRSIIMEEPIIYTNLTLGELELPVGYNFDLQRDTNEKFFIVRVYTESGGKVINPDFATIYCKKNLNTRLDISFEKEVLKRKISDLAFFKEYERFLLTNGADPSIVGFRSIKEILYTCIVVGNASLKEIGICPIQKFKPNSDGTFDIDIKMQYGPDKHFVMTRCPDGLSFHHISLAESSDSLDTNKNRIYQVVYIDQYGMVSEVNYVENNQPVRKRNI